MPRNSDRVSRVAARRIFESYLRETQDYRRACQAAGVSERTGRRWRRDLDARQWPSREPSEPRTSFEGRAAEIEALDRMVDEGARLITLTGAPGIGKTRLAWQWAVRHRRPGKWVVFCDLRAVETADAFVAEVARHVDVQLEDAHEASIDVLGRIIASRGEGMLVLDNFEQLIAVATPLLERWVERAGDVCFLVTSRRHLRLQREALFELPSLSLPETESGDDAWNSDAVKLFWARARAAEPSLRKDALPIGVLVRLVRHLEGHPLVIELAAAQLRRVGVTSLLNEVKGGTNRLKSTMRDADPGQATLAAAFSRSWNLLSGAARVVLARLSVFRGGFTLNAARAVVELHDSMESPVDEVFAELRESSLLRLTVSSTGGFRWDLYEATREFASDRLSELGHAAQASERHAAFFLTQGERWVRNRRSENGHDAREALNEELRNLRRAFEWFLDDGATESVLRMALVLYEALVDRFPGVAGQVAGHALDSTLVTADVRLLVLRVLFAKLFATRETGDSSAIDRDLSRARVYLSELRTTGAIETRLVARLEAEADFLQGKVELRRGYVADARATLERSLDRARLCEARDLESSIRTELAVVLAEAFGDPSSLRHHRRAVELARSNGDAYTEVRARMLDALHRMFFQRTVAWDELEAVRDLATRISGSYQEAFASLTLSVFYYEHGRWAEAEALGRRTRELSTQTGLKYMEVPAAFLVSMPMQMSSSGKETEQLRMFDQAARLAEELRERRLEALARAFAAGLYARLDDVPEAIRQLGRAYECLSGTGDETVARICLLQRVPVLLASARAAEARGTGARRWLRMAERALAEAESDRTVAGRRILPLSRCSWEGRHLVRLARVELARRLAPASLAFRRDGSAFRFGDGDWQRPEGPVSRALLCSLVDHRIEAPGVPISTIDLMSRCWPGERMAPEAGFRRVRSLVRRLRRAGFGELVRTGEQGGYYLDPEVEVAVVPEVAVDG